MKEMIPAKQLLAAIILVPLGSAILFFVSSNAKQDAWIVILIYMIPAIVLQLIYTSLYNKYPNDTLVLYIPKIFGKFFGFILSILYIIFFAYLAARVLRDFSELILISMMPKQPLILISISLSFVVGVSVYLGYEVICRATYIFLYLWIAFSILEWIFLFNTPDAIDFSNLKPILQNGILNITKESWKLITFPYGESILFTMFYPYIIEKSKVRKATILGTILLGILLSLNTLLFISVLGVNYASTSVIPLLQTLRIMRIGEAFDRVDIFFIMIVVIIGFIKISFFTYGSMLGTAQLFKFKKTKNLAIPFTIGILITSLTIADNYPKHVYIGLVTIPPYVHVPLEIVIPILALLIHYFKKFLNPQPKK